MASRIRTQISERAISWMNAEIGHFDPFCHTAVPPEAEQTAMVEVALIAMTLQRRSLDYADRASPAVWLDAVAAAYLHPGFHQTLFRGHKHAFSGHLLLWLALSPDRRLPVARDQIQKLIDLDNVIATERLPYRVLELRYLLELGNFRHELPDFGALTDRCFIAARFNPIDALDHDIYALTHAAFYLSDYGARDALHGKHANYVRQATRMLLAMMVRRRHWDLVAELLLTLYCLGAEEDQLIKTAWCALADAQMPDGSIPEAPGGSLVITTDPHDRFLALYHRTLTALLAAALCWRETSN